MKKILVTGTRHYLGIVVPPEIDAALKEAVGGEYGNAFVIHGDYPTGIDAYTTNWCSRHEVQYAKCPAFWGRLSKAAGPIRNKAMLQAFMPDIVLAFPAKDSIGTNGCVALAVGLGLKVKIVELNLPLEWA